MPQSPDRFFGAKLTRRDFLKLILFASTSACSSSTENNREVPKPVSLPRPTETPPAQDLLIDEGLRKIGTELENWTLSDGRKMADLYGEVREVRDLLTSKIDPRVYLPNTQPPLRLGVETPDIAASLFINPTYDLSDSRKTQIKFGNGTVTPPYAWILNTQITMRLSSEIQGMGKGKLPFVVKEFLQLINLMKVYQLYLDNVPDIKAMFLNPSNVATRVEDILFNRGFNTSVAEENSPWKFSNLDRLIDEGSGIQVAPIYGTCLLDNQIRKVSQQQPGPKAAQRYLDFANDQKLIKKEDGRLVWANTPPVMGSSEGVIIIDKYIKRYYPGQAILK